MSKEKGQERRWQEGCLSLSILETGSVSWELQNKVRDACAFI